MTRPRPADTSPNYIVPRTRRHLVYFPTQAEAELRRGNRRRTIIARMCLVTMALAPTALIYSHPAITIGASVTAAVVFVACCVVGAQRNERTE